MGSNHRPLIKSLYRRWQLGRSFGLATGLSSCNTEYLLSRPTEMRLHTKPFTSKWDNDPRQLAASAIAVARESCTCNYPYHILWPLLRAAGIKGTLRSREDEVLARLLGRLVVDGARVLIAGSADTATLCTVGRMTATRNPNFTVLDRCPAPLKLIQEFAAERQISCRTLHADLADYGDESRWDIVLAHYTFQFIPPEQRGDVLKRLSRSLAPGGTLICVDKEVPHVSLAEAPASAAAWLEKAKRRIRSEGLESALPAPLYDQLLRQAAEARTSRRVTIASAAELVDGMRRAGLTLIEEGLAAGNSEGRSPPGDASIILAGSRPD
jgi:hypothetical protein